MTKHMITTSMQPGVPIEVTDEELMDLKRMGLEVHDYPTDLSQVPAPTPLVGKSQEVFEDGGVQEEPEADGGEEAPAPGE